MVVIRNVYSKGRTVARGVLSVFAIVFGFVVLFFTSGPKLWSPGSSNQNLSLDFSQDIAHADVPGGGCDCASSGYGACDNEGSCDCGGSGK